MGQDELVLKVPAPAIPMSSTTPSSSNASSVHVEEEESLLPKQHRNKNHSRESSGASVKYVNKRLSKHHRRTSSNEEEDEVIILSPSEDLTLSDRLSCTDDLEDIGVDVEVEMQEGCEEDFRERLGSADEHGIINER